MRRTRWHGGRAMLNLPGYQTTAAIVCEVENTSGWSDKERKASYGTPYYTFHISDCDRAISLNLDGLSRSSSEDDRRNDLHKIDSMIEILMKFRTGVALEHARAQDRRERYGDDDDD